MRRSKLASRLLQVRRRGPVLDDVPADVRPPSVAAAYAVADEVVAALVPALGRVAGYKVGATSAAGQKALGLEEPFYGRCFASRILRSQGRWRDGRAGDSVEAEVGVLLARPLPPRPEAYTEAEVRAAIGRVLPLLEINRPAYARPFEIGGRCLIADNGVTQALVRGVRGLAPGRRNFARERVVLSIGGREVARGSADVVLGDPLRALHWLANALSARGRGLAAGDLVATGAMTPPIPIVAGDTVVARYSSLGTVTLRVGDAPASRVMARGKK
ncbi:MAG: fumarylacetoacetate hydrolase family protein [Steroidobacteraceae bacterium]|jgi:2-keto-4-pentenoate hydratase|nr:fumarylacetoacetate hydrolase family protein [Steroidobacteraceae bacterium]